MKKIIAIISLAAYLLIMPLSVFAADYQYGYDVSHNNNVLSGEVFSSKGDFVMIRLGYTTNHLDRNFFENVKAACENKIPYGVYLYSYAYDEAETQGDADFVIEVLSQLGEYAKYLKYPVAYDLEESRIAALGKKQVTKQMDIFCSAIEKAGYIPMVYANTYWFNNYIDAAVIKNNGYKVWYAYYPGSEPDFSSPVKVGNTGLTADMWQYKKGDVAAGTLDENIVYNADTLMHQFKRTKVTPAGFGKDGIVIYQCTTCDLTQEESIPALKNATLSKTSYVYDDKDKKPSVIVKDTKGNTISNISYSLSYSDKKYVGTATVTVKFKGNYSGTKKLNYTIKPKGTSISKLSAISKGFTIKINKQTAQTTGYQIRYADNKSFKNSKTVTINSNKTFKKTIKNLKKNKKYFVEVRTYKVQKGKKYYSSWSKAKTVTTKK